MANTTRPTIGKRKKQQDLSAYPLSTQLRIVIDRMIEQKIDPLETLVNLLDPNHDHIVKPTLKPDPRIPIDTNKGVFRVIFSEIEGKRWKLRTQDIEAHDGYDAVDKFLAIGDNQFREKRRELVVSGVECVIIPSKVLKKFREDWSDSELDDRINTLMEAAKDSLVAELEQYESESKTISIEDFITDNN